MAKAAETTEAAALQPLLDRLAAGLPPERARLAAGLARAAYRRLPAEQLAALDLDAAAAHLAAALDFMDGRRPGTLALRVLDPAESDPYGGRGTLVELNVEDGPFLLSTVTEELNRLSIETVDVMHPVLGVRRDDGGRIAEILPARHAQRRESYLLLDLGRRLPPERSAEVAENLRRVLSDAQVSTRDFPAMRERLEEVAFQTRASAGARYGPDEVDEVMALLRWLLDDHFILLGYREYDLVATPDGPGVVIHPGSGLGILADEDASNFTTAVPLSRLPPALRARTEQGELLIVSRTNRVSTVHRQIRMVYIGVRKVAGDGTLAGEFRLLGLFAQKAFAEPASAIPVLRRKLRQILEREDIVDHSYDERAIRTLFESFPKHELFRAGTDELRRTLVELLEIARRQAVRLLLRRDEASRSISALVTVPRERFSATLRQRVQRLLVERLSGTSVDYQLSMTERDQALLHFMIHVGSGPLPDVPAEQLEREISELTRTWADDLADALHAERGEAEARRLLDAWIGCFPPGYTETTSVATAVADLAELERLPGDGAIRVTVARRADGPAGLVRFRLYKTGPGVELSSFLPLLESLGLTVVEEIPYRLDGTPVGDEVHIHDYGVRADLADVDVDVDADGPRLAAAALAIWSGRAEADSLNRLVIRAGMPWDEIAVLRAYRRYRRQVGTSFTEPYTNDAVVDHPEVARALLDYFRARFDPESVPDPDVTAALRRRVVEGCDAVARLDHDRILRGFLGLIDATVRTNRWQGHDRLSLKLLSAAVPSMPKPVPHVEVFVYSPRVEGIHLRGGSVARGGLRWSDRLEDFRTEVLGLMKAQMTKNAVIVPTGSKGGFVLKRRPQGGAGAVREEVQRQYETFVRGLLDVTDNVVDGVVVPPDRVRRVDGDDPYLVVAADRGTATFSDVANAISAEFGFWLGDAFASGGSHGYDHKAMGITARGAWVAVQRHFRELDIDVQTDPVTVVGVGDMSGDVFGNAMLRSRSVKLVAAFDHRDILLDPDPDPARAFDERRRLYDLPRSSWQAYDRALISAGGGVWSRGVKEIPLSAEVRAALRIGAERLTPPELIRALLAAPVDLLFFGGIGTFVKASDESAADVGDRANDAVRIDARNVGARVISEGGNLAVTQRGRIQYARRGGRCNTDAIDNSAGVDTSDHEVNLKILLAAAAEAGAMTAAERDELLTAMAGDVVGAVLRDVYLQTWAISQELAFSPGGMEAYEALMTDLVDSGRLDRDVEALPSTAEMDRRRQAGAGFTRPELAVLLGYAKVDLVARLLASGLPDQPHLEAALEGYFPPLAVDRFGNLLGEHRLRRELVATVVGNDVVNRMGITYVSRTAHEMGCMAWEVAAAYWVAREVSGADTHWRAIEALDDRIDPTLQLDLKLEVDRLIDAYTRTYIRHGAGADVAAAIAADRPAFDELEKAMAGNGWSTKRSTPQARAVRYTDLGIEPDLAERIAALAELTLVPDVATVARTSRQPVRHVCDVFFSLSDALPLDTLNARLLQIAPTGHWERWQHRGLTDELRELRRAAAASAIAERPDAGAADIVNAFLSERAGARERAATLIRMLESEAGAGLEAVAVAVRALRDVVA